MNPGIEFEFAFLWNVVGQILILCRTCMMRKWSSIKTKTKPLARPGKKAVAKSKHCRWILMPCCPISGKWGATRLIHFCFMAKHCQINFHLIFDYSTYRRSKSKVKISQNFVAFSEYMNLTGKDRMLIWFLFLLFQVCLSLYTDANPIIPRSFLTNLVNKFKHTAGFAHPRQQQNHHTRNHHIYGSPLQGLCFPSL